MGQYLRRSRRLACSRVAVLGYLVGLGSAFSLRLAAQLHKTICPAMRVPQGIYCLREAYSWCCLGFLPDAICRRRSLSSRGAATIRFFCKSAVGATTQSAAAVASGLASTATTKKGDKAVKIAAHSHIIEVRPSFHAAGVFF